MSRYTQYTASALLGLVVAISGCGGGTVDSEDLKTQGIHATVRITASGNTTHVDARLTAGGPNGSDVELSSGDVFTATAYGETKTLSRKPQLFGAYDSYVTDFNDNISNARVSLRLTRANDPDAPNSYINLPEPVNIHSHPDKTTVSAAASVTLNWDTSTINEIEISTNLSCQNTEGGSVSWSEFDTVSETGSYTLTFNGLVDAEDRNSIDTTQVCNGSVHISRTANGVLDSHYDGGNIKATQSDLAEFDVLF